MSIFLRLEFIIIVCMYMRAFTKQWRIDLIVDVFAVHSD